MKIKGNIQQWYSGEIAGYVTDTGAADVYAIAVSPAITAYTAGLTVKFKVTNTNTGASTLNVNTLGPIALKKDVSTALAAGDLPAGKIITAVYDGTNFQIMSGVGSGALARNGLNINGGYTELGGTLLQETTINGGTYKLIMSATIASNAVLTVNQLGATGNAIEGTGNTSAPIIKGVQNGLGAGVWGNNQASGVGVEGWSVNAAALQGRRTTSGTNDVQTIINVYRNSTGTASNGLGGSIDFGVLTNTSAQLAIANRIISKWTDATFATRTSQMILTGVNSGTAGDIVYVNGNGMVGIGSSVASATRLNVVDNSVAGASIVNISTTSTAAAGNSQIGLNVSLSGANSNASETTRAINVSNIHTGTGRLNHGIYISTTNTATNGAAVYALESSAGFGVFAQSNSGTGVYAISSSGNGCIGVSNTLYGGYFGVNKASTNTVESSLGIVRNTYTTAANGMGASLDFFMQTNGAIVNSISNQVISEWTDAITGSRSAKMRFTGVNNAVIGDILTLNANKSIQFNGYVSSAFTGTPVNSLLVDASGNVIMGAVTGSTSTKSKGLYIEFPTASESVDMWKTQVAITVSSSNAVLVGSSTPSVTYNIAFGTDRTVATNVFSVGQVVTSTTTGLTSNSGFNDATIPAGSFIWVTTSAQSGTVTSIGITINYTED